MFFNKKGSLEDSSKEQHSIDVFANPRQDRLSHDWPSKAKRQSNSYSKASAGRGGSRDDY